jgi:hypothetical protein
MTWLKVYKKYGKGNNLWEAMNKDRHNNCHEVDKWIDEQAKEYMTEEYDHDRIRMLVWETEEQNLINFFTRLKINLDSLDNIYIYDSKNKTLKEWIRGIDKETHKEKHIIDRNIFDIWHNLCKNELEKENIMKLKRFFEIDLEKKRDQWASERAQNDFELFITDINCDNDEEVEVFFGIKSEIEAMYDDETGDELPMCSCEFCVECGKPNDVDQAHENKLKKLNEDMDDGYFKYKSNHFLCDECGAYYKMDKEHMELNKHLDQNKLIARCI